VNGLSAEDLHLRQITTALIVLTVGSVLWSYFDLVAQTPRDRARASVAWMFAHLPGRPSRQQAPRWCLVAHSTTARATSGRLVLAAVRRRCC